MMSPPVKTVCHQQSLESLGSSLKTWFTPLVEKSLGSPNIPFKCYLTLRRQAGELKCFQPWISNFEITISTPTIPKHLELEFQLRGGIVTLPVPSNLQGFGYSSWRNWHLSLSSTDVYSNRTLMQYQYLSKLQIWYQAWCPLQASTQCSVLIKLGPGHKIKSDYYPIWPSNPDLVLTIQVCSSTHHCHWSWHLFWTFCEHFKK